MDVFVDAYQPGVHSTSEHTPDPGRLYGASDGHWKQLDAPDFGAYVFAPQLKQLDMEERG